MDAGVEETALYLVRFGVEITTKAKRTRARFQRRLARNLRAGLDAAGVGHRLEEKWSRILLHADDPAGAADVLRTTFGVHSFFRVDARIPAELDAVVERGEVLFRDRVRGRPFKVEARRSGQADFSAQEVRELLGAALNRYAPVNLSHPEVTVRVEARDGEAFLFSEGEEGPGGLPVGVEGRAVCLVSGGFDSAAAAWMALKRGVALDFVFCNLGGGAYERSVLQVAKVVADHWSHGAPPTMHVLDFDEPVEAMKGAVKPSYWQLVLKRLMYRAGERVAEEVGADALVTGEAIGQVSSQTLPNLRAIEEAVRYPVIRPLVTMDKPEIIALAHRVGTASLSAPIREYCDLLPGKPVTAARPEAARREEAKVDLSGVDTAVEGRKVFSMADLDPRELVSEYLFRRDVPEEAVVVDCRSHHHFRQWHWPGAVHHEASDLVRGFRRLDKDRTYLLYCSYGLVSADLAEQMQQHGYDAYAFRGGVNVLRAQARQREREDRRTRAGSVEAAGSTEGVT